MKKTFLNFVFMFSLILSNIFIFCGCDLTIKEETKYKITFIVDNQAYSIVEFSINEEIDLPDDPIKEGYTFDGWYLEAGFENEIETIDTSLLQNYNLYAKFTINQYTMTFNTNGGSEISSITQDYNSAVVRPSSNPTRAGYEFGGWYTDNNTFENEYEFTTMPLNGITIYAKWNIETYTITYHLDNGTNGNNPSSYTINTNDIILEDASKTGYTFNGWYLEAGFENEIETIDTSIVRNALPNIIYYIGSAEDWLQVEIIVNDVNYGPLNVKYYSEVLPAENVSNYWHCVNGMPTIWE